MCPSPRPPRGHLSSQGVRNLYWPCPHPSPLAIPQASIPSVQGVIAGDIVEEKPQLLPRGVERCRLR